MISTAYILDYSRSFRLLTKKYNDDDVINLLLELYRNVRLEDYIFIYN